MTYNDWVTWLETRNQMPTQRPGLDNIRSALKEAGLFDKIQAQKVIHISGTNGKGTTAKTLEQLLLSTRQSVGLYTSPHLVETTERIRINDKDITQNNFVSLCSHYRPLIEKWHLTHFEALTLFACDYFFKQKKVDWAIFEIGLGGTWDATNVIPHDTSVITTLSYDHMDILGTSLEEIALNKFGIIQKGNTVVHGSFPPDVQALLREKLLHSKAKDVPVPTASYEIQKATPLSDYILKSEWGNTRMSLPGARAAQNMLLALTIFKSLGFDPRKHLQVLAEIDWPARMTPMKTIPFHIQAPCPVYLSGDHNKQGIESLVEILKHAEFEKLYLIMGVSKNRSPIEFLQPLAALKNIEVVLTKPQFQGVTPTVPGSQFFEKPSEALKHMAAKATAKDLIVITGSLYLCGDYLKGI